MTAAAPRISAMREIAAHGRRPAMLAGLAFVILIGATPFGEISSRIQFVMVLIGGAAVLAAVRSVRRDADAADRLALAGYLLLLACVAFSNFPRQSIEIAFTGLGVLAIFWLARRELADERSRRALLDLLTTIALLVGSVALLSWGNIWLHWVTTVGTLPPELSLPGFVFGNVHDVAILVLLCAPAALVDRSGWRRWLALATVAVAVGVAILDASRNILLAVGIATVIVGGLTLSPTRMRRSTGFLLLVVIAVLSVVALAVWTGFFARMINPDTLGVRIWLWTASVELWLADPLFGQGPGTFPWLLSLTDYFTQTTFAPRHPDNALAQLLAEGGLVGVAAGASAVGAVLVGMRAKGRSRAVVWALVFYMACGLFANPTDFGFLIVPAVLWAGLATVRPATPPDDDPVVEDREPRGGLTYRATSVLGALALVGALSYPLAGVIHDGASAELAAGDSDAAAAGVRLALGIDPSHALYERELGTLLLNDGDFDAALVHLRHAVAANPSDLAALRLLALAAQQLGDPSRALEAAEEAVMRGPSDIINIVTLAHVQAGQGRDQDASELVAEVLSEAPWVTGALDLEAMGIGHSTADAVHLAADASLANSPMPVPGYIERAWLAALSGNDDLLAAAVDSSGGAVGTVRALDDLLGCRIAEAQGILDAARATEGGSEWYWIVRYMVEEVSGFIDPDTAWFVRYLLEFRPVGTSPAADAVHNGLADFWGYGRRPLSYPQQPGLAPSELEGLTEWMRDPVGTAALRVPERPLGSCRP